MFIITKVIGKPKHRQTDTTPVAMVGVQVNEVAGVRQGIRLDPHHCKVLPLAQVILIRFAPSLHIRWERLAADLDWQELLFGAERGPPDKTVLDRIKIGGEKVVEHQTLCGRSGVTVEDHSWDIAVDMRKHFRHEMLAQLTAVVAQSVRVVRITRKEKQTNVLKRVRAQNHEASPLKAAPAGRINIFGPVRPAVLVGSDPNNTAMSPQIEIAGGQCLRNRREEWIPFFPVKRAEPVTPRTVSCRGATAIWDSVNPDSHRMGVQTYSFRCFFVQSAQPERARGRHRQRFASLYKRIRFVACNPYFVLKKSVIRLEFFIGDRPIR